MSQGLVDSVGHDIDQLPNPEKKGKNKIAVIIIDAISLIFFTICVFIFVNFPSVVLIGRYLVTPEELRYEFPSLYETQNKQAVVASTINPAEAPGVKQYPDNNIYIPKIGIQALIGWDTSADNITEALTKNVVHLENTSKPGENGDIFITGHSSNYWWVEGKYNSVFALLPQLEENDEIIITYQGQFFHYKVTRKDEVKSSEVSDRLDSDKERLTLMTCVPVGTNLKRLLINADRVK